MCSIAPSAAPHRAAAGAAPIAIAVAVACAPFCTAPHRSAPHTVLSRAVTPHRVFLSAVCRPHTPPAIPPRTPPAPAPVPVAHRQRPHIVVPPTHHPNTTAPHLCHSLSKSSLSLALCPVPFPLRVVPSLRRARSRGPLPLPTAAVQRFGQNRSFAPAAFASALLRETGGVTCHPHPPQMRAHHMRAGSNVPNPSQRRCGTHPCPPPLPRASHSVHYCPPANAALLSAHAHARAAPVVPTTHFRCHSQSQCKVASPRRTPPPPRPVVCCFRFRLSSAEWI